MKTEDDRSNNTARDAWCPKCRGFEEVIWNPIELATVRATSVATFKGLSMRCRICDFEITKVGKCYPAVAL